MSKGKYEVLVFYSGERTFLVEADSEEEAEKIALRDAEFDDPDYWSTDIESIDCIEEPNEEEINVRSITEEDNKKQMSLF